jgi:hypothetical protein
MAGQPGVFAPAAEIAVTLEQPAGADNVLFIRFYEGPSGFSGRWPPSGSPQQRLEALLQSLPDVDQIMGSLPTAIRRAIATAATRGAPPQ